MTDLACIIGYPVARSLSPVMHNAAFAASGLDWTYVSLAVQAGALDDGMRLLDDLGARGVNVTVPHKQAVIPYCGRLEGDALVMGAVNTLVRQDGGWVGHNTDGAGFVSWLRADASFDPAGRTALIVGAGGAARGVAVALSQAGARVVVIARRREQAVALASLAESIGSGIWGEPCEADLIVQATSARDGLPLDSMLFGANTVAVDLIYPPPPTPFVQAARAAGSVAYDGLGMLIHQAALSFKLWTGVDAPLDVMAAAARSALTLPASDR